MNLLQELSKKSPNRVFIAIALGGLAGICNAFLIPIVLAALIGNPQEASADPAAMPTIMSFEVAHIGFAKAFFALCAMIFLSRMFSRAVLVRASMNFAADLRITLGKMIANAPIAELESIGPARLTAVLTQDVARIVMAAQILPGMLTNVVTLVGTLGFLLYLNAAAFRFVIVAIVLGALTYQIPAYFGARLFAQSRDLYDGMQEAVRGLIYGAKELKLDAEKRRHYFDKVLVEREMRLLKIEKRAYTTYIAAATYGDMIGFLVIGIVAFMFINYYSLTAEALVGIVMALLYVAGPVSFIMTTLPEVTIAKTSFQNIERMLGDIREETIVAACAGAPPWERLRFEAVTFRHAANARYEGFAIGPIDLEITRGEIAFIVGGNGSGKSTLSKLISLHYGATGGTISFGDQVLTQANIEMFRQEVSAVFSDYYLFDRILSTMDPAQERIAQGYLRRLGLDGKVSIEDGLFSTLRLSDGQRKRLALLVALLDDKALYIFDEWAADQDPGFKDVFYKEILPELKARGKAVVVISHDDRYFDRADRLFVLDNGQLRKPLATVATLVDAAPAAAPCPVQEHHF